MSPAKSENANRAEKRDHRREVTDSIIKMLEDGVAPWQKPWEGSVMPFNPTTERPYRGGNALHLLATGMGREYADPRWMTYKQAAEQGWQVRGGEKGTHIEFWEVKERSDEKDAGPDQNGGESPAKENGQRLIHRVYTVFNANQIDGIPEYQPKQRTPFEAVQAGERILANSGARIEHDQRDDAFYNRRTDSIHLPPKDTFKDAPGYYGTALHELAHWTGHPSRLNRPTLSESYRFGDLNYAKEELRAELASVFMAAELGVPHDPANHAAYVGSWIKALREDKNEIFRAAHEASAATDFVLSLDLEASRAETLELAGSGAAGSLQSPERSRGQKDTRDEVETFQPDRELVADAANRRAFDENGVGQKARQTDDNSNRSAANTGNLAASFAAAKQVTADALGESARTFGAQTDSGRYNGRIIGETAHHVVQRLSPQTAVAHMKHLLEHLPHAGDNVAIAYSNDHAQVRDIRERVNTQERGR
jgi:antirestriction protein ArdC